MNIETQSFPNAILDLSKALKFADLSSSWSRGQSFLNIADSLKAFKVKILCTRARVYHTEGQNKLAQSDLGLAEEIQPSAAVYYAQARFFRREAENKKSSELCTHALSIDAKFTPALRLRGEVYLAESKNAEAERDFDRLCMLEPENPQAHFFAGLVKLQLNKVPESLKAYDRSIELDPNTPLRYFYRASARNSAKQYHAALEDLDYFIRHDPQHNSAPMARAQAQQLRKYLAGQ
ncbi:MAG: tetratricopeptide repeat protein [Planctomycetota bacterium]|nr:tetratricopeptide repeat protein [Planctomycetota bacterium]